MLYFLSVSFWEDLSKLLEEIKIKSTEHYGERLVSLVVFGSVAGGRATPESDIDLLIVLEEKPKGSYLTYMDFYDNVESRLRNLKNLGMRLSPIFLKKSSLREYLPWLWNTEFIVLYDKDGFFQGFLRRLEKFKRKIKVVKKPMPHFVVKNGK